MTTSVQSILIHHPVFLASPLMSFVISLLSSVSTELAAKKNASPGRQYVIQELFIHAPFCNMILKHKGVGTSKEFAFDSRHLKIIPNGWFHSSEVTALVL